MIGLMLEYAKSFIGVNYKWGGENPLSGFDCSGFVQEVLASIGMDPQGDQTAQALYNYFVENGIASGAAPGALCFYGSSLTSITHITLMLDNKFCIGANGGGSAVIDKSTADKKNAFIKIRPYNYRKDLVAVIMPNYV